jgi:RNA-directed DNA polymerase
MLIAEINPIITGWANYYRSVVVGKTFNHLDYFLYNRIWRYAHRRHPTKSKKWLKPRYFTDDWRLKDKNGAKSRKFWDYPFKRWVRLRHLATPDNPEEEDYWNTRRSKATPLLRMKAALWKRQKGLCERCQGILDNGEEIVVHHRDKNRESWKFRNLELIHDMCHQKIHHQRTA